VSEHAHHSVVVHAYSSMDDLVSYLLLNILEGNSPVDREPVDSILFHQVSSARVLLESAEVVYVLDRLFLGSELIFNIRVFQARVRIGMVSGLLAVGQAATNFHRSLNTGEDTHSLVNILEVYHCLESF